MFQYSFDDVAHVVQTLHPAYFALVMATGIVAISAFLEGLHTIAVGLSWFNAVAFILLCVIYLRVWFSIHVLFFETLQTSNVDQVFYTGGWHRRCRKSSDNHFRQRQSRQFQGFTQAFSQSAFASAMDALTNGVETMISMRDEYTRRPRQVATI